MPSQSVETQRSEPEEIHFSGQPGLQQRLLSCEADVAVGGGAAGAGKSWQLLLDVLRGIHLSNFNALIFRRESTRITEAGALWDNSGEIYSYYGAESNQTQLLWNFPSGAKVKFGHMEHEKDRRKYQGAQVGFLGFDEVQEFTENQFWFMFSRLRSMAGIRPWARCTCNPVPIDDPVGGWLRKLIDWWIDDVTGLPIQDRAGVIRWFARIGDDIEWRDTKQDLIDDFPKSRPMSFTFIPGKLTDNPALLEQDPEYETRLANLPKIDRERLLYGNWNARETAGMFFQRQWFPVVPAAPTTFTEVVRYWDRAATPSEQAKGKGSWTAGVKMGRTEGGLYYVLDVVRFQGSAMEVEAAIKNTATQDGPQVRVGIEQDPGQAGKAEANYHVKNLAGYNVFTNAVREAKGIRARPLSAQVEGGNVYLVQGKWVELFLRELENFDGSDLCTSDQTDAASGAFHTLTNVKRAGIWGG